uniref:Transmembrane protein 65 n=1 Tax=Leptobrachium leishanense TaxID=445787 RepID=A0A8C5N1U1_9ANUR
MFNATLETKWEGDCSTNVSFYLFLLFVSEKLEVAPPTTGQLKYVFFHNALPFVGFGFLDNAIMIAAGTQIELSIGVVLGISTMAAAALGNLVSDLAGLGYVERLENSLNANDILLLLEVNLSAVNNVAYIRSLLRKSFFTACLFF